jgi:hypothetical protein
MKPEWILIVVGFALMLLIGGAAGLIGLVCVVVGLWRVAR